MQIRLSWIIIVFRFFQINDLFSLLLPTNFVNKFFQTEICFIKLLVSRLFTKLFHWWCSLVVSCLTSIN